MQIADASVQHFLLRTWTVPKCGIVGSVSNLRKRTQNQVCLYLLDGTTMVGSENV